MSRSHRSPRQLLAFALLLPAFIAVDSAPPAAAGGGKEAWGAPGGDIPALRAAAALYEGIRPETLPNGLRVYLKPVPGAATVTTMVAYKVGSADEDLDHTG